MKTAFLGWATSSTNSSRRRTFSAVDPPSAAPLPRLLLLLHLRRGAELCGRSRLGRAVRHQGYVHATVLGPPRGAGVHGYGIVLAQTNQVNLVRRNVIFLGEVLDDGVGAALAELIVVIRRPNRIGVAFNLNDGVLLATHLLRELVECLFVLAREIGLVEGKQNRGVADRLVVVQILDRTRQAGHAMRCLSRILVGLVGSLTRSQGFLIGVGSLRLRLLNALLGARVGVSDVVSIFRRQII